MLTLAALVLALPAAALPQDRVRLADGTSLAGKVTSATLDQIQVEVGGHLRTAPAAEVLAVQFGELPPALAQAEGFLSNRDYQNAVNLCDSAIAEPEPGGMMALLCKAEAQLAWAAIDPGQADPATATFREWIATYPNHFLLPRARTGLAQAMALAQHVEEAARELEEVASLAFEKNLPASVEFGARLARCKVYLDGHQAGIAATRLQDLVPKMQRALAAADTPEGVRSRLRQLAGEGQTMLGDAIEADQGIAASQRYWEGLLRDPELGPDVRAAATLGLAKAARAGGQPRQAQLLAARVVATMAVSDDLAARALYLLGEFSSELGDDIATGRSYFRQVADRFPATSWAILARAKVGE